MRLDTLRVPHALLLTRAPHQERPPGHLFVRALLRCLSELQREPTRRARPRLPALPRALHCLALLER